MKKIIFLFLITNSQFGWSQEIKLSCNYTLINSLGSAVETHKISDVLLVTDDGVNRGIKGSGNYLFPMATWLGANDRSDSNKWEMSSEDHDSDGSSGKNYILIDRNTGNLWYTRSFSSADGVMKQKATGVCEKVNTNKKKF